MTRGEEDDAQILCSSGRWVPWWLRWNGGTAWMVTKEIDATCWQSLQQNCIRGFCIIRWHLQKLFKGGRSVVWHDGNTLMDKTGPLQEYSEAHLNFFGQAGEAHLNFECLLPPSCLGTNWHSNFAAPALSLHHKWNPSPASLPPPPTWEGEASGRSVPWWMSWNDGIAWMVTKEINTNG